MTTTPFLVIGAGPYGLAAYAYAKRLGLNPLLVGRPLDLWKHNMPSRMLLRSSTDWHLDPAEEFTFEAFIAEKHLTDSQIHPISLDTFLAYTQWFQEHYDIQSNPALVQDLRYVDGHFEATLENEEVIQAERVLLALGLTYFVNAPESITSKIPNGRWSHTCYTTDFEFLRGRRCLIIGGRQSAYEWAALIYEAGGAEIHLAHRQAKPTFEESNWSWVNAMIRRTAKDPGWFRRLPFDELDELRDRFWIEGRLKLEPWLAPRIKKDTIHIWQLAELERCTLTADQALQVTLDTGDSFEVDHIILATGYVVDINNVPFLSNDSLRSQVNLESGFPVLDEHFQSSLPGLYFSGLPATRDFGPFFGFTAACAVTGKVIVEHILKHK